MCETRKIAAILVSDVVGYSRLAGADEDRTLARLRALRSDLIDPTISVHHGRIVKRTGDGIVIEFRSVVDAVRCAIEVQSAMVERNAGVAPDKRIEFRVGIHLGDVVEESDGDLMGDGVNIAARLEGIAEPGRSVCPRTPIAGERQARYGGHGSRPDAAQEHRKADPGLFAASRRPRSGETCNRGQARRAEKAFLARAAARRDRGVLIVIAAGAWYFLGANRPAQAAHLSIVVLPFTNLSGDPAQDYFADGITENLTTDCRASTTAS